MTDEERQKLCDDLWLIAGHERPFSHAICAEAADEIERLVAENKRLEHVLDTARLAAFEEAAEIANSFGDRHEEYEIGDAIRAHGLEIKQNMSYDYGKNRDD